MGPDSAISLSVAIVTRNRPSWLYRCVQSWRQQEFQPAEIIISDDSDLESHNANRRIADDFCCRLVPGPKRGLYANRNHAFYAAQGTHVMTSDDDHTHPAGFSRAVRNAILADPNSIWTFGEKLNDDAPLSRPGELRRNGTIGPPTDEQNSAAIACGSTVYPRKVFDMGLRCDETYAFGGLWYLWGHSLRRAGFRIRHSDDTFVWHHSESGDVKKTDTLSVARQVECYLYVQAVHALRISGSLAAVCRMLCNAVKLITVGGTTPGYPQKIRLTPTCVARVMRMAASKGAY
jgi:glycosyltransferase involved in cell wall biosynthesis